MGTRQTSGLMNEVAPGSGFVSFEAKKYHDSFNFVKNIN
jgi:hypothetical protein